MQVDGQAFLADVGFGSGLLSPAPLIDGEGFQQGDWTNRLRRGKDDSWWLETCRDGRWDTSYVVPAEATYPIDIAVANHFTSTYPGSPFVRSAIVVRKDETAVRTLRGRQLSVVHADGREVLSDVDYDELGQLLADLGVALDDREVRALIAASAGSPT